MAPRCWRLARWCSGADGCGRSASGCRRVRISLLLGAVTFTTLLLNLTEAPMGEVFATIPFYALLIELTILWRRRAATEIPQAAL